MNRTMIGLFVVALMCSAGAAGGMELTLTQITFPERVQIEVDFQRDARAPEASMVAVVKHREGQAIDLVLRLPLGRGRVRARNDEETRHGEQSEQSHRLIRKLEIRGSPVSLQV